MAQRKDRNQPVPNSPKRPTADVHVAAFEPLDAPDIVKGRLPADEGVLETVRAGRRGICQALAGENDRLVVIVGPCSIHDPQAAMDYARHLAALAKELADKLIVVMRVYFEKPRTTVGWKGLINDPHVDGTHDINAGLHTARELLLTINALGLPCATEFLDPIIPQYTADLVTWVAIGARTTESQTHREMASGLSMPVGFKNATDGSLQPALNALLAARQAHAFLGIDGAGATCIVRTSGNPDVHLVLRGGGSGPNYRAADIERARESLDAGDERRIMVDCSHGNTEKDYTRQPDVFSDVLGQFRSGQRAIVGMMLESNLIAGRQNMTGELTYGVSITDACIDWPATDRLLREAAL
ncbi:MAG: 3-deoxy-7-phosphoheptulonate synthase [Planctomycetota bacterium]